MNRYAFVYSADSGDYYEDASGSVVRCGDTNGKRCRLLLVTQQVTTQPHLYYCEDGAGVVEKQSLSELHGFSIRIQVKTKEESKLPKSLHALQCLKGYVVSEEGDALVVEMAHYVPQTYKEAAGEETLQHREDSRQIPAPRR